MILRFRINGDSFIYDTDELPQETYTDKGWMVRVDTIRRGGA